MIIAMNKNKKNDQFVWYKFEIKIEKGKSLDHKGREVPIMEAKYGVFKFDKVKDFVSPFSGLIKLEKDITDSYFINKPALIAKFLIKMEGCKKNNIYPDTLVYANCDPSI